MADAIAGGNLTRTVVPASERDRLAIAFNRMTENLRTVMQGVAGASAALVEVSAQASLACDQSAIGVEQVSKAILGVAGGARDQLIGIQTAKIAVEELSSSAMQIADGAAGQASAVGSAGDGGSSPCRASCGPDARISCGRSSKPMTGPRPYDYEVTTNLNFRF